MSFDPNGPNGPNENTPDENASDEDDLNHGFLGDNPERELSADKPPVLNSSLAQDANGDWNVGGDSDTPVGPNHHDDGFVMSPVGVENTTSLSSDGLSYLHPSSLVFDILAHGKTYLVPALFGLWGAAQGDMTLIIISAVIFVPAIIVSVFRYFTLRYSIQGDKLVVNEGLVFKKNRTVPVKRIQNIDFVQNPLHRLVGVAEVRVETASGTKPEATLRVISMAQMESLRSAVFGLQARAPNADLAEMENAQSENGVAQSTSLFDQTDEASVGAPSTYRSRDMSGSAIPEDKTILEIPISWLLKAGLASNRGMIMVGVAAGFYFQFSPQSRYDFQWIRGLIPADTSVGLIVGASIVGLIVLFILLRLFGIGWYVLRFFGYKLVSHGDDLRISCGLFTKVSATVPRKRVQFISVHRNLLMRFMGLTSIRIETAGGAGKNQENATETVSKRWFVPVIPEEKLPELLSVLRPELGSWDESTFEFKSLSPKAKKRLCRLAFIQAILFSVVGLLISRYWGWALGIAALPLLIMWAIKKSKSMRYARTENGVVYRSGVLNRKTSITFFEKIQTLRVDQSPFDRRWNMARLSVDTAAAGPADHRIEVPYLDENFAQEEFQLLRVKTGQEQPVFG
ncbi:MAG: PH domain-containing protein [Mariniblastus sp.]